MPLALEASALAHPAAPHVELLGRRGRAWLQPATAAAAAANATAAAGAAPSPVPGPPPPGGGAGLPSGHGTPLGPGVLAAEDATPTELLLLPPATSRLAAYLAGAWPQRRRRTR